MENFTKVRSFLKGVFENYVPFSQKRNVGSVLLSENSGQQGGSQNPVKQKAAEEEKKDFENLSSDQSNSDAEMEQDEQDLKTKGNKIVVAENNELKLFVKLDALKRMTKFNVQDLLYKFDFEKKKPDEDITVLSVTDILEKGLAKTLEIIQNIYSDQKEDLLQLFVVFQDYGQGKESSDPASDPSTIFTFNSGRYDLWQDATKMSKHIWAKLSTYFQSNKEFSIERGFYFSMTNLHAHHTALHKQKPYKYRPSIVVGSNPQNKSILANYGLGISNQNYFEVPKIFSRQKMCLPATLIYAKARNQKRTFEILNRKHKAHFQSLD